MTKHTDVFFLIDTSGSMASLPRHTVMKYIQTELENHIISNPAGTYQVIGFDENPRQIAAGSGVTLNPAGIAAQWTCRGTQTGIFKALAYAKPFIRFGVPALFIVLTDGQDNNSTQFEKSYARELIHNPNVTVAFLTPPGGRTVLQSFGVSYENVREWEQTEREVERITELSRGSTQAFYEVRSTGVTRSNTYFAADLSGKKNADVTKNLNVTTVYRKYEVPKEAVIEDFVREKTGDYIKGTVFYELIKKEKVQPHKQMLLLNRKTGKIYAGDVRGSLGFPGNGAYGDIKVEPGNHGDWRIFVQSTSVNRKLPRGSAVLVQKL